MCSGLHPQLGHTVALHLPNIPLLLGFFPGGPARVRQILGMQMRLALG